MWKEIQKKFKWELFENLDIFRKRLSKILLELTPKTIISVTGWDLILEALSDALFVA
ncbi:MULTISPECIES: hypothetical protein [Okeania]|uniref:hypothetical protein n=1 Tax=Okeania TaxID=1458928 RepID=UPI001374BE35|nr:MULTISPECIES: hypothetical protein [Okeania]NEP71589.1 hypothetical protein [Okeania sp. SIO2G5]NEP92561.1 hypothetical protein [Okeania sp. SIO2F5]NEQ90025.1 hypothetical protein [Okeania sp. SIO2G4]NES75547.1 hypothetical protein [Okeania sp. SIO1H4]NES90024.1 hypothetical protein [Okeania sp. SIO2B9]